jgi:hypothetical protein
LFSFKLRNLVRLCLNLNKELRPDITEVHAVAKKMHSHFQQIAHSHAATPSPAEMQQNQ